jgi:hypothetical protein
MAGGASATPVGARIGLMGAFTTTGAVAVGLAVSVFVAAAGALAVGVGVAVAVGDADTVVPSNVALL